jgi:hypothetical protein
MIQSPAGSGTWGDVTLHGPVYVLKPGGSLIAAVLRIDWTALPKRSSTRSLVTRWPGTGSGDRVALLPCTQATSSLPTSSA